MPPRKTPYKEGEIVGKNKIIAYLGVPKGKTRIYYLAACIECGKERLVRNDNLNKICRSCAARKKSNIQDDITGRTFGKWTVLYKAKKT